MGRPADKQQDQRLVTRLRDDRPHPKLRPVKRGYGIGHADFACQLQRVQARDMDQAGGPGQPGGGKQDHGPEHRRSCHIRILSRSRRQVTRSRPTSAASRQQ